MSLTIFFTKDNLWSASVAGPITKFLVETFKGDIYLSPVIQAIYDENIDMIDLGEFTTERRLGILQAFSTQLVPYMEKLLPNDISNREERIELFQDLADKAALCLKSEQSKNK